MKYYNVKLPKAKGGTLIYPEKYQPEIGDFAQDHLYYDDAKGESNLLLAIEDGDANNIVRDGVTELTEAEAVALSEAHEPRTEVVTDDAKIRRLTIKASLGQAFTADELKAIDPDDSTVAGIEKTKNLADRITVLKSKEAIKVAEKIK